MAEGRVGRAGLEALGSALYGFLFETRRHESLETLLNKSLGATRDPDSGLRIRIQCDEANPDIAAMPWEYLYSSVEKRFVATSVKTPLVRFIEVGQPIRPMEVSGPLRVLLVVPVAADLATDREVKQIEATLAPLGDKVALTVLDGIVTPDAFRQALVSQPFDVIHFMGHGDFSQQVPSLRFNDPTGGRIDMTHDDLGGLLRNHLRVKLVVLNSCHGGAQSSTTAFLGMAPRLIEVGIPAVIAMQFQVTDAESLVFAEQFYHSLFTGYEAGSVDFAVAQARSELERRFPEQRSFGVPVLFSRYHEGVLFAPRTGKPLADLLLPPDQGRSDKAMVREHRAHGGGSPLGLADPVLVAELSRANRRVRIRAALGTAVAGLILALAFAVRALDLIPLSWIVGASPVLFGDPVARDLPLDSIVIVTTQQTITPEWRPRHAQLVNRLSEAGARVVVLDIVFSVPRPEFDDSLAAAFTRARARGTTVVFGATDTAGAAPKVVTSLAAAATVGSACLGENEGRFSGILPLFISSPDGRMVIPSMSLAALAGWRRGRSGTDLAGGRATILDEHDRAVDAVIAAKVVEVSDDSPTCPLAARGARYAEVLAVRVPVDRWRDPVRRFDYAAVLDPAAGQPTWARDKIVLVGEVSEKEESTRRVGLTQDARYGVERHADAVATLLNDAELRLLGGAGHLVLIGIAAVIGGWLGYRRFRRRWVRWAGIAAAMVAFAAVAASFYYGGRVLVDLVYPMAAMMTGMGMVAVSRWGTAT